MLRRALAITAFVLLSLTEMWGQYDPSHFYLRGRRALIDGKYSSAIESFNILSVLDTSAYEAFFYRGIAKYNLGDYNGAEKDFNTTLRINPVYTPAYHYRGITRSQAGNYDKALEDLATALELRPGHSGLYFSRGVTYFLSQQFEKAVKDFNRFIKQEPEEDAAYLNRGASFLFLGDTTKALNDYNKALSINRFNPESYIRRSRVHALQGNFDQAIDDLNKAIALDEDNTFAYFNRAILMYEAKRWKEAIKDLNRVLEDEPGNALTLYNRALIYMQVTEYDKALNDLDRVININPNNVLAIFNRAAVFMEMKCYRDAIIDYDRAIELYPDFAKAYMNRSYAKSMIGKMKESKQDFDTAQKKIAEYRAKNNTEEGALAFADTTKQYNRLLELDAEFAKKDFDNELLQYRDIDIRLKPLFQFSQDNGTNIQSELASIGRRRIDEKLDAFFASSPIKIKFDADKPEAADSPTTSAYLDAKLSNNRDANTLFAKGITERASRQYNSAKKFYDEAITRDIGNAYLYINRGALEADMIEFISSMDNNVQVLTVDNTNTAKTVVKDNAQRHYDYSNAISDMYAAASLAPNFPYVYYNLGNLHCLSNNLPEAIQNYNRALKLYPYIGEAYYNRGLVEIFLKDKEKGCIDISKAGELGIEEAYSVIKRYCTKEKE